MRYYNHYKVKKFIKDSLKTKGQLYPDTDISEECGNYKNILNDGSIHYAFLGHSSVFLNMNNINVLIDPVFSIRVGTGKIYARRFPGPKAKAEDFPEIDYLLITHNHYDHLDRKTIISLKDQVKHFIVPSGVAEALLKWHIPNDKIIELDWFENYSKGNITITSTPAHHCSYRTVFDYNRTLWCSYVIEDGNHRVFHSGDTAYSEHFENIFNRYYDFDLTFMECGQYGSMWHDMHMFPEESANACKLLSSRLSVPIHWGAYRLSDHPYNEPIRRFENSAKEKKINYLLPVINRLYQL